MTDAVAKRDRRVEDLESAMKVVAAWISEEANCKVIYTANETPTADVHTKTIRIPVTNGLTPEAVTKLRSYVYHECAHILDTDPEVPVTTILNALEDYRIERLMSNKHPGCGRIFSQEYELWMKDVARKLSDGKANPGAIWFALISMNSMLLNLPLPWNTRKIHDGLVQKYIDACYETYREIKTAKNTKETEVIAHKIRDILKDLIKEEQQQQQPPEQQPPQQNEKQEQESDSGNNQKQDSQESEESESGEDQEGEGGGSGEEQEESEEGEGGSGQGEEEDESEENEGGSGQGDENETDEGESEDGESGDAGGDEDEKADQKSKAGQTGDEAGEDEQDGEGAGESDQDGEGSEVGSEQPQDNQDDQGQSSEEGESSEGNGVESSDETGTESESGGRRDPSSSGDTDPSEGEQSVPVTSDEGGNQEVDESLVEQIVNEQCEGPSFEEYLQQEIGEALEKVDHTDGGYRSIRDNDVYEIPEIGDDDPSTFKDRHASVSSTVMSMSHALDQAMRIRTRCRRASYMERGTLDVRRLPALAKSLDKRIFYQTHKGIELDTCVSITIDESGSMQNWLEVQCLAIALGETLHRINVPFEIIGSTTLYMRGNSNLPPLTAGINRTNPIVYKFYKIFNENWLDVRPRMIHSGKNNHNVDGEVIETAALRLTPRRERRKIIFSLSDGLPNAGHGNKYEMANNLRHTCEKARKAGIEVYGFGIGTRKPAQYYGLDYFIYLENVGSLGHQFFTHFAQIITEGRLSA